MISYKLPILGAMRVLALLAMAWTAAFAGTLTGTVSGANGGAVAGAKVAASPFERNLDTLFTATGPSGAYSLELPDGDWVV